MTFLPVAQRELLAASRRRQTFAVRWGAGGLAVAAGFIGLLINFTAGGRGVGSPIFYGLVVLAAVVTTVAGVLQTVDSLSSERREGTLGFLFLTDLTGFDVLAGKLAAAGLSAGTALLAVFPVLAIAMILGGVTAGEFWRCAAALLNLLWVALAVGLMVSVRATDGGRALVAAGAWVGLLWGGLPALHATLVGGGLSRWNWMGALSPVTALMRAGENLYVVAPDGFWTALGASHAVGWLMVGFVAWRLPRTWRDEAGAQSTATGTATPGARRPRPLLGDFENPIAALHRPTRRERWLVWSITAATLGAAILLANHSSTGVYMPLWGSWPFAPGVLLLKLIFAWRCCAFFFHLRQGAGELLLTAPVSERQILGGAWIGARALVQLPLALLLGANLLLPVARVSLGSGVVGGLDPLLDSGLIFNVYGIACHLADLVALAWLAARFGLRSGNAATAFGRSLALVFLSRVLFCVPDLLLSMLLLTWARSGVASGLRGHLTGDRLAPVRSTVAALRQGRIAPGTV